MKAELCLRVLGLAKRTSSSVRVLRGAKEFKGLKVLASLQ